MNIEKIASAIEADAGESLADLRQALKEANDLQSGRVTTSEQILVRATRTKAGLSQQAFAELIGTPTATLRDWEQGRYAPPGAVLCLLRLLLSHPEPSTELAVA